MPVCCEQFSLTNDDEDRCPHDATKLQFVEETLVGQIVAGRYQVVEFLGEGGWSSVYRATRPRRR